MMFPEYHSRCFYRLFQNFFLEWDYSFIQGMIVIWLTFSLFNPIVAIYPYYQHPSIEIYNESPELISINLVSLLFHKCKCFISLQPFSWVTPHLSKSTTSLEKLGEANLSFSLGFMALFNLLLGRRDICLIEKFLDSCPS